jgi:hypothetical protein
MRPDTIIPGHAGIPSTEGYSRDLEGARQWLEDVRDHTDPYRIPSPAGLTRLQRWALEAFGLWRFVQAREEAEFARGRRYVANTTLAAFLSRSPAPKGWAFTD